MADGYSFFSKGDDRSSVGNEEFDEEDVWAVFNEKKNSNSSPKVRISTRDSASASASRRSAARMIPRSTASAETRLQQSAPVNIPDWSKIYRNRFSESSGPRDGSWAGYGDGENGHNHKHDANEDEDGSDGDENDERIPPHEWIARKLARSQISSFSMCEGAGRTLKGRDLSRVRNAVLTKTGFLE